MRYIPPCSEPPRSVARLVSRRRRRAGDLDRDGHFSATAGASQYHSSADNSSDSSSDDIGASQHDTPDYSHPHFPQFARRIGDQSLRNNEQPYPEHRAAQEFSAAVSFSTTDVGNVGRLKMAAVAGAECTSTSAAQNSDDEHAGRPAGRQYDSDLEFVHGLRRARGFDVVPMKEDGACLFRAIAFHVMGDQEMHDVVRERCIDYMGKNRDHFAAFVTENFDAYLRRKRDPTCYGNNVEMQAFSEMYCRNIEVFAYGDEPINTFRSEGSAQAPIRVSYHNNIHYNAVVDPNFSTFGVGLGFSDLTPGAADARLIADALTMSEHAELDRLILDQELKAAALQYATSAATEDDINDIDDDDDEMLREALALSMGVGTLVSSTRAGTAATASVEDDVLQRTLALSLRDVVPPATTEDDIADLAAVQRAIEATVLAESLVDRFSHEAAAARTHQLAHQ